MDDTFLLQQYEAKCTVLAETKSSYPHQWHIGISPICKHSEMMKLVKQLAHWIQQFHRQTVH